MTTTSGAPGNPGSIDATTALLQAELPRLEEHQQTLEKDLAAVTERLESVRAALSALRALSLAPELQEAEQAAAAAVPAPVAEAAAPVAQDTTDVTVGTAAPAGRKAASGIKRKLPAAGPKKQGQTRPPAKKNTASKRVKAAKPAKAAPVEQSADDTSESAGGLTEQVIQILADAGDSPVRARDVAAKLGRDDSPGSINAVRSTLDRLVATSRAHRAGRGLYQSPGN
ncbi:hypothetical protein OG349_00860 [Streptomyces sp. NBC_01317]|uniref:hypothetical protein n=1 Tax=Streptomyces sp. NBC_01317 TaxID=2903822 RepID=UPI002E12237D|nr:hypothetical protein OG349_00860 [Streptomyces sp. NBC_01317]